MQNTWRESIFFTCFDLLPIAIAIPLIILGLWFGSQNVFAYPLLLFIPIIIYFSRPAIPLINTKLFLIVLLLAVFMRFLLLSSLPYGIWHDEALLGVEAVNTLNGKAFSYQGQIIPENSALPIYWTALFIRIFGEDQWALRLPAALAGVFTVVGIYFLGRALENEIVGFCSALVLAVMSWHVIFSRLNMHTIMAPLFVVWMLWAAVTRRHLLAGLLLGLGCYSHQSAFIGFVAAPLFVKKIKDLLPIYIVSLAVISPLVGFGMEHKRGFFWRVSHTAIWNEPSPWNALLVSTQKHLSMLFWQGDPNPRHGIAHAPRIDWLTSILLIVGLCGKNSLRIILFYFLCLLPGILSFSFEAPQSVRSVNGTLAVALLAGMGMEKLYRWASKRRFENFVIGVLGLGLFVLNFSYYFIHLKNNPRSWNECSGIETQFARTVHELNNDKTILVWPGRSEVQLQYLVNTPQYERVEFVQHKHIPWVELHQKPGEKEIHFLCENRLVNLPKSFWEWHYPGCKIEQHTNPFEEDTLYRVSLYPGDFTVRTEPFPYGLEGTYIPLKPAEGENAFTQIDPIMRFRWHFPPFKNANFNGKWSGFIEIPENGMYKFSLICDRTSTKKILKIDEAEIIHSNFEEPEAISTIVLTGGKHRITIEYESFKSPTLWLRWKTPSMNGLDTIPYENLTH